MRKRLTKDQIFTIPNAMSVLRLVLIPFIVSTYWNGRPVLAVILVAVSALSDIFDGVIARKLNMVSDLGKFLDPLADKFTHAALLICVSLTNRHVWGLFVLLAAKELTMFTVGLLVFRRRDHVQGAQWHGKLCTVIVESSMMLLMLFPQIPAGKADLLLELCAAVMLFSLVMYLLAYARLLRGEEKN